MNKSNGNCKKREEFYEAEDLSILLNFKKGAFEETCERYGIKLCRNENGDLGLYKHELDRFFKSYYYFEFRPRVKPENDVWLLTVEEAAEILQTSKRQVQKLIRNKIVPTVKVGRETRILYFDLIESTHTDFYLIENVDSDEDIDHLILLN